VITSRKIFICKHQIAVSGDISDFAGEGADAVVDATKDITGNIRDN
jgi:hypothetical protein